MPRQTLPVQDLVRAGAAPVFTAATQTDLQFPNDGRTVIEFKNTNAAARTATISTPGSVDGNLVADLVVTEIPLTTGDIIVKPLPVAYYNQQDGNVYIDLTAFANVTVGLFRI